MSQSQGKSENLPCKVRESQGFLSKHIGIIAGNTAHVIIFCSFLLDRLMAYENVDDSSSDSDMTASSDSETETNKDTSPGKK